MSSGAFVESIYQTDDGTPYIIRVQPETIAGAWNPAGTGTPATTISVKATGSHRALGIHARVARFRWAGTPPAGYKAGSTITLPILTKTAFDNLKKAVDYPYLGVGLNLVGKTNEAIK
jgi:hypothetical protein